jgi:membrane protein
MKEAAAAWYRDNAPSMGASIAFYSAFSIAPLFIIATAIAGFFFGTETAKDQVFTQMRELAGPNAAAALQAMVSGANRPEEGLVATVTGLVIMVVGASAVFIELQYAIDRIWKTPLGKQQSGWWYLVRRRILGFGLMLCVAFLLLVSLFVSAAIAILESLPYPYFGESSIPIRAMNFAGGVLIVAVLFALLFKFLPQEPVPWPAVIAGSAVTAVLFEIGKISIEFYIRESGVASGFGVAGSLVVLLLWVYYSAQIFLFGAELTRACASHYEPRE